jgi:hypothetical protein
VEPPAVFTKQRYLILIFCFEALFILWQTFFFMSWKIFVRQCGASSCFEQAKKTYFAGLFVLGNCSSHNVELPAVLLIKKRCAIFQVVRMS